MSDDRRIWRDPDPVAGVLRRAACTHEWIRMLVTEVSVNDAPLEGLSCPGVIVSVCRECYLADVLLGSKRLIGQLRELRNSDE